MITKFKIYEKSSHSLKRVFENKKSLVNIIPLEFPCFKICLEKLGMSKIDIDHWMKNYKNGVFTEYGKYPFRKTITIVRNSRQETPSSVEYYTFTWYWYPGGESNEDTEFAGVMNCTNEEIENYLDNIEREKNIKTYNL